MMPLDEVDVLVIGESLIEIIDTRHRTRAGLAGARLTSRSVSDASSDRHASSPRSVATVAETRFGTTW